MAGSDCACSAVFETCRSGPSPKLMQVSGFTVSVSRSIKMAESRAVVSRVRVLAITHILVGVLLIIFGIADGVTQPFIYIYRGGFIWIGTGTWVSVHCRNSAFVRYKLLNICLAFASSCPLARRGENRRENKSKPQ